MINHLHLRAFHAVAEAGSFTAAAQSLRVSQPTLSEQVRALEQSYRVELFTRAGRAVQLTPLGEELQQITRRMTAADAAAERLLSESRDLDSGHVRLATDAPVHAIGVLAELERRYPGLQVSLTSGNSDTVVADVADLRADLAITADGSGHPELHVEPLMRNDLLAVVPAGHPFADRRTLAVSEFVAERVILREAGSMTRRRFENALADAGLAVTHALVLDSREAVLAAIAEGLGVSVIAERELPEGPRLAVVELDDLDLSLTEYVVCRKERRTSTLVEAAFNTAHDVFSGSPSAHRDP